jgi:hypothetical protein
MNIKVKFENKTIKEQFLNELKSLYIDEVLVYEFFGMQKGFFVRIGDLYVDFGENALPESYFLKELLCNAEDWDYDDLKFKVMELDDIQIRMGVE